MKRNVLPQWTNRRRIELLADIRAELRGIWNLHQAHHNEHLVGVGAGHDVNACGLCRMYVGRKLGVRDAIRHFGGRPR